MSAALSAAWGWLLVVSFLLPLVLVLTYSTQSLYDPSARVRTPWGRFGRRRCRARAAMTAGRADPVIRSVQMVVNLGYALWVYEKFWLRLVVIGGCALVIVASLGSLVDRGLVDALDSSSQPWGSLITLLGAGIIVISMLSVTELYRRLSPATYLTLAAARLVRGEFAAAHDPWLVTQRVQRQVTQLQDDVYRLWLVSPYSEKAAEESGGRAALFGLWWALQEAKLAMVSRSGNPRSLRQAVTACLVVTCSSDWEGLPASHAMPTPPRDLRQVALRVTGVAAGAATLALAGWLFYRQEWSSGIDVIRGIFLAAFPAALLFGLRGLRSGQQRD